MKKFDEIYYIRQVLSGNQSAYAEIVDQYKNMGMTIAMRILKCKDEAEEAKKKLEEAGASVELS